MGRRINSDPADVDYFNQETFFNELDVATLADGTKRVLTSLLVDSDGNALPKPPDVVTRGGQRHQLIFDINIVDQLKEIVTQLKLANMYSHVLKGGSAFKKEDIET